MIECFKIPTAPKKNGIYYSFTGINKKEKGTGVNINNIVLIEDTGQLENNRVGILFYIQISKNIKSEMPVRNDIIDIDGTEYRINTVIDRSNNPAFYPFWECEIKKIATN